jgi:hypothetical protein
VPARLDSRLEGCTVLVAVSEPIQGLDLRQTLRDFGCAILGPVGSAVEALKLLDLRTPDLALLGGGLWDGGILPAAEVLAGRGVPFLVVATGDEHRAIDTHLVLRTAPRLIPPYRPVELHRRMSELRRTWTRA